MCSQVCPALTCVRQRYMQTQKCIHIRVQTQTRADTDSCRHRLVQTQTRADTDSCRHRHAHIQTCAVGWLVGCLTSQQQTSVSQGRICSDNLTCCHTEIEVADPTFHLTQSQYTDTGPTSSSADPITPGAWQGSYWSANFEVTGMTRPRKNLGASGIRTRDLPLSRRTP